MEPSESDGEVLPADLPYWQIYWSYYAILILCIVAAVCVEPVQQRGEVRFAVRWSTVLLQGPAVHSGTLVDVSLTGASLASAQELQHLSGALEVRLPDVGVVAADVVWARGGQCGLRLNLTDDEQRRLTLRLFCRDDVIRP